MQGGRVDFSGALLRGPVWGHGLTRSDVAAWVRSHPSIRQVEAFCHTLHVRNLDTATRDEQRPMDRSRPLRTKPFRCDDLNMTTRIAKLELCPRGEAFGHVESGTVATRHRRGRLRADLSAVMM